MVKDCFNCKYSTTSATAWPCCRCIGFSNFVDRKKDGYNAYGTYVEEDIENTRRLVICGGRANGKSLMSAMYLLDALNCNSNKFKIKNVIFNDPATIVFWDDGTKTVVKCSEGDKFDPEKGLAMAITKKALGNKYDYYNTIKHWLKKYKPESNEKGD